MRTICAHLKWVHILSPYRTVSTTTEGDPVRKALSYCIELVRTHDYENYLWCIQLEKELRAPILSLRAFDIETSRIAAQAKSDMLIMMRYQWWRDGINSLYKGRPAAQPVMTALHASMQHSTLTRYRIQRMINAKEEELLRQGPPESLAALEEHADGTATQLLCLQLEAARLLANGRGSSEDGGNTSSTGETDTNVNVNALERVSSHVGKATWLAGLLRHTPLHAERQRSFLPADLCDRHGISPEDLMRGEVTMGIRDVVCDIAMAARDHLQAARASAVDVPPAARPLFLPSVATELYLNALEKVKYNVYHEDLVRGGYSLLRYNLELKCKLLRGTF